MQPNYLKPWRLNLFFAWLLVIALFGATFVLPMTSSYWQQIDQNCFYFLNSWIVKSPFWQTFWALANHSIADWVEDGVIIAFFGFYIFSGKGKEERLRRTTHLFILALTLALIITYINQGLFRKVIYFGRESPSITMEPVTVLSDQITWIKVKCRSHSSFPSDHATTALFFGGYYCIIADKMYHRVLAFLYAAFLCLPRLVIGAHWITDVLLGAGTIVVITLSLLFLTPLHNYLERLFIHIFSLKNKWKRA